MSAEQQQQQQTSSDTYFSDNRIHVILDKLLGSCADDPKNSVHRAWGISLIFVLFYFLLSIVEMINLQKGGGRGNNRSWAVVWVSIWLGLIHLGVGVLGTFVLKRFPTSFSIGFLLGVLLIVANQNLIFFGTFSRYATLYSDNTNSGTHHIVSMLGFVLFLVLTFFMILLFHFNKYIVVSPIDTKGWRNNNNKAQGEGESTSNYERYENNKTDNNNERSEMTHASVEEA